jgi:hypothetical protein
MKGSQKDRSECTKEEEKRQTFVRFEVRSLHCGVKGFRSSLLRVLFPHLTRPPLGNSFSVPQQEIAVQCIKGVQCTWRDCSAVHQGSALQCIKGVQRTWRECSAVHMKRVQCGAVHIGNSCDAQPSAQATKKAKKSAVQCIKGVQCTRRECRGVHIGSSCDA